MLPAASDLDKIVSRALRKAPSGDRPVLAWPLACGSAVAQRTRAIEFQDGILQVMVPDAGWRRELQALAARYLAQLNKFCADDVARIEFVVAGARKPNR
jgi:predicted nucleic acid-binding Zn ribbon protein